MKLPKKKRDKTNLPPKPEGGGAMARRQQEQLARGLGSEGQEPVPDEDAGVDDRRKAPKKRASRKSKDE